MSFRSASAGLLVLLVAGQIAYAVLALPTLPEQMATHFDASGVADGWSSRESFAAWAGGVAVLVALVIGGVAVLVGRAPATIFNLPHRDYWLAPERERATRSYIQTWLLAIGVSAHVLLATVLFQTVAVNRAAVAGVPPVLPIAIPLTLFLVATAAMLVALFLRFRAPRASSKASEA